MDNQTAANQTKRERAIESFIEKKLQVFLERQPVQPYFALDEEGEKIKVIWRFFINHQFFIERVNYIEQEQAGDPYTEYIRVVRRENNDEIEYAEQPVLEGAPTEEVIIRSMIEFLFAENLMVIANNESSV